MRYQILHHISTVCNTNPSVVETADGWQRSVALSVAPAIRAGQGFVAPETVADCARQNIWLHQLRLPGLA
jgi:hypothetical protein